MREDVAKAVSHVEACVLSNLEDQVRADFTADQLVMVLRILNFFEIDVGVNSIAKALMCQSNEDVIESLPRELALQLLDFANPAEFSFLITKIEPTSLQYKQQISHLLHGDDLAKAEQNVGGPRRAWEDICTTKAKLTQRTCAGNIRLDLLTSLGSLAYCPNGRYLLAVDESLDASLLDLQADPVSATKWKFKVNDAFFSIDCSVITSTYSEGQIQKWSLGSEMTSCDGPQFPPARVQGFIMPQSIAHCQGDSSQCFAVFGEDGVQIWDSTTLTPVENFKLPEGCLWEGTITRDGHRFAAAGYIRFWERTEDGFSSIKSPKDEVLSTGRIQISRDGMFVALWDETLRLWSMDPSVPGSWRFLGEPKIQAWGSQAVCFSPNSLTLAVADNSGWLTLLSLRTDAFEIITRLKVAPACIECVSWSPRGQFIAIASAKSIYLIDIESQLAKGVQTFAIAASGVHTLKIIGAPYF